MRCHQFGENHWRLNIMKKRLPLVVAAILSVTLVSSLSACKGNDTEQKHHFVLSDTNITLVEGGETYQLTVYDGKSPYLGQISWVSSNEIYATVYQGIVKGMRAGSTVVSAKMGKTVLNCNVTVNKNLTANIDSLVVYAGSGDIDVTLAPTELVPGSSARALQVRDSLGDVVPNCLYENNGRYYVHNVRENKLNGGKYSVDYQITSDGLSAQGSKNLTIKAAEDYQDLFILDPIDGTEKIVGNAINADSYNLRYDENPGKYVTYNEYGNTGFTEENNFTQNREQFLESLQKSGYNGYFSNNTKKGYDMTYRLYAKKDNYTTNPKPFFFVDLLDTANPVWNNLNDFPADASIDIWVRCYFRPYGQEQYQFNQSNWMYLFRGMNDSDTYVENCSSFAVTTDKTYGWSKYSLSISKAKNYLSGAKHIGLCWETNSSVPGEFLYEIYSVELSGVSDYIYAPNFTIKNELTGNYTNVFDDYSIEIVNKETGVPLVINTDYTIDEKYINLNVPLGVYTLIYHAKRNDKSIFDVSKTVYAGIVSNLSSADNISRSGWLPENESGYYPESPVGLPSETIFENSGVCYNKAQRVAGRAIPAFKIPSLFSDIENISNDKKLVIYAYFTHPITNTLNYYLSVGWPHLGGATPTNNGMTIYYNGGWGGKPIENQPTKVDEWTTIEIPITSIKDFMATRPDISPDTFSFEMRYGENNNDYVYFYAVVLK